MTKSPPAITCLETMACSFFIPSKCVLMQTIFCSCVIRTTLLCGKCILVPRGRAPFGQHQESRPLAVSNNGSPRFTDFPSLCACSESSLTSLIGSGLNLFVFPNPFKTGMSLDLARGRDSWCWPKGARPLGTRMWKMAHRFPELPGSDLNMIKSSWSNDKTSIELSYRKVSWLFSFFADQLLALAFGFGQ